jgi:hypothetical protein
MQRGGVAESVIVDDGVRRCGETQGDLVGGIEGVEERRVWIEWGKLGGHVLLRDLILLFCLPS